MTLLSNHFVKRVFKHSILPTAKVDFGGAFDPLSPRKSETNPGSFWAIPSELALDLEYALYR